MSCYKSWLDVIAWLKQSEEFTSKVSNSASVLTMLWHQTMIYKRTYNGEIEINLLFYRDKNILLGSMAFFPLHNDRIFLCFINVSLLNEAVAFRVPFRLK